MIISFSGFARSGKDTAVQFLVEERGFIRLAFADKLREFLYALNPIVDVDAARMKKTLYYVQDIIESFGWDGYKETPYGPEIRRLLQRLGTEAGRQVMWDTIWIDATMKQIEPGKNYAISDARFLNEFDAVTGLGGRVIRIERAGVGPANDHASEMEALDYDFDTVIHNDGTLEEFKQKVLEAIS